MCVCVCVCVFMFYQLHNMGFFAYCTVPSHGTAWIPSQPPEFPLPFIKEETKLKRAADSPLPGTPCQ